MMIVAALVMFFQPKEAEAIFERGKWKTEYTDYGDFIQAFDYCTFSIFIKECHASEVRDIRIYTKVEKIEE